MDMEYSKGGAYSAEEMLNEQSELIEKQGMKISGTTLTHVKGGLDKITVPLGITRIGNGAFSEYDRIKEVRLPSTLEYVEKHAFLAKSQSPSEEYLFYGTDILVYVERLVVESIIKWGSITFEDGKCPSFGNTVFDETEDLSTLTVPEWTRVIKEDAFMGNTSIKKVIIEEGVTEIGSGAFYGCESIETISLPKGLKKIGAGAFDIGFGKRVDISVPSVKDWLSIEHGELNGSAYRLLINGKVAEQITVEGVEKIGSCAFYGNSDLRSVTLGRGVKIIGSNAFTDCSSLTEVRLGGDLEEIRGAAFSYTRSLKSIEIPEGVSVIGNFAFEHSGIEGIKLPKTACEIGKEAFLNTKLRSITFPNGLKKIGESAFKNTPLTNIEIPEGVCEISERAFSGCPVISATLPSTLDYLGAYAFDSAGWASAAIVVRAKKNISKCWAREYSLSGNKESRYTENASDKHIKYKKIKNFKFKAVKK